MFLNRTIPLKVIFQFAWKVQLATFLLSAVVYLAYHFFDVKSLAIPFLPVATIGTAVAFYVGFKNNSAYDRLWEARRIWGGITKFQPYVGFYDHGRRSFKARGNRGSKKTKKENALSPDGLDEHAPPAATPSSGF